MFFLFLLPFLTVAAEGDDDGGSLGSTLGGFFGAYYGLGIILMIILVICSHCGHLNRTYRAGFFTECYYTICCCNKYFDIIESFFIDLDKDKCSCYRSCASCCYCLCKNDACCCDTDKEDAECCVGCCLPTFNFILLVIFFPFVMIYSLYQHTRHREREDPIEEFLDSEDKQAYLAQHPNWPTENCYKRNYKGKTVNPTIQQTNNAVMAPPSGQQPAYPQYAQQPTPYQQPGYAQPVYQQPGYGAPPPPPPPGYGGQPPPGYGAPYNGQPPPAGYAPPPMQPGYQAPPGPPPIQPMQPMQPTQPTPPPQ